jgi:hypothetical protein
MNGLWTAEFGSSAGLYGTGVVVLHDGIVMGGDDGYYYLGEYALDDSLFSAAIRITPFVHGKPSIFNTFGQAFTLRISGQITGDTITAQGHPEDMPTLSFGVKLIKRA